MLCKMLYIYNMYYYYYCYIHNYYYIKRFVNLKSGGVNNSQLESLQYLCWPQGVAIISEYGSYPVQSH